VKNKLFNAYTYFIIGLVLLTAVTFVEVPCPACDGAGRITGVLGIEVVSLESDMVSHYELGMDCGWDFERYTYDVKLTLENWTDTESWGVVLVTFHDPDESYMMQIEVDDEEVWVEVTGKTLLSYPWFVEVPAKTTLTFEKRVNFEGVTLEFFGGRSHQLDAKLATSYPCPFHGEKAKVPFPTWLRLV
jgi:hypothetical protein